MKRYMTCRKLYIFCTARAPAAVSTRPLDWTLPGVLWLFLRSTSSCVSHLHNSCELRHLIPIWYLPASMVSFRTSKISRLRLTPWPFVTPRPSISSYSFDVNSVKKSLGRYSAKFNVRILTTKSDFHTVSIHEARCKYYALCVTQVNLGKEIMQDIIVENVLTIFVCAC